MLLMSEKENECMACSFAHRIRFGEGNLWSARLIIGCSEINKKKGTLFQGHSPKGNYSLTVARREQFLEIEDEEGSDCAISRVTQLFLVRTNRIRSQINISKRSAQFTRRPSGKPTGSVPGMMRTNRDFFSFLLKE